MRALQAQDARVFHKLLQRLCVVPSDCPIGFVIKEQWYDLMQKRMSSMVQSCGLIKWDRSFNVDWSKCGLYALLPAFVEAEGKRPEDHDFEFIECCGQRASLTGGGFQVKASWSLASNWSLSDARLLHPTFADMKMPCYQFFCGDFMNKLSIELVPELRFVAATVKAPLALSDAATGQQQVSENPTVVKSDVRGPPLTAPTKARSAEDILKSASTPTEVVSDSESVQAA
eukprot:6469057-Amphidinium_carterae.1